MARDPRPPQVCRPAAGPDWERQALVAAERVLAVDPVGYADDAADLNGIDAAGVDGLDEWEP